MSDRGFESIALAARYDALSDPQFTHGQDLLKLLALRRGDRIFDVGCGTGRLAALALEQLGHKGRIVGIDPALPRIELARHLDDARLEFRVGRGEDLSGFDASEFDALYMNSVLRWFENRPRAFAEAYRVLKPGGRIGVATATSETPNELSVLAREAQNATDPLPATAPELAGWDSVPDMERCSGGRGPSSQEVRELLHAAGFRARVLENRTYVSTFADVAEIIEFMQATVYGNLLPGKGAAGRKRFRVALERAIARSIPEERRSNGIRLERYVLLAIADKPA
jgi:ubiquinone/menaquinone biosynthesis C-methylase UbiE